MNEPPVSPGPAPETPAASPPPSLEAQVVRLGLMTTAEVATTMQEQAETGRPFAELAVEHGRINPDDLARLTAGEAAPAAPAPPAPVQLTTVPSAPPPAPPELAPAVSLLRQPEPTPTPAPEPQVEAAADPEPVVKITLEPEAPAAPKAPEPPAAPKAAAPAKARVFVRLTSGERISAGTFDTADAAERRARELMIAVDTPGNWPRVEGRYIKPDTVVSIDVDS